MRTNVINYGSQEWRQKGHVILSRGEKVDVYTLVEVRKYMVCCRSGDQRGGVTKRAYTGA